MIVFRNSLTFYRKTLRWQLHQWFIENVNTVPVITTGITAGCARQVFVGSRLDDII